MTTHSFTDSLDLSAAYADAPWWESAYRAAFPDLEAAVPMRGDGWGQRGGIDRLLTLRSGKTIAIDEKVRDRDWPDFCLEFWSDYSRRMPGWVAQDLACDYIAYAFVPSGRCYLLPFQDLRRAWRQNGAEWVARYRDPQRHVAHSEHRGRSWETWFVPVPIEAVLRGLSNALLVHFRAQEAVA